MTHFIWFGRDQIKPRMKHKVKNHFEGLLFRANLAKDLPTSQGIPMFLLDVPFLLLTDIIHTENSSKVRVSPDDAWQAFDDGIDLSTLIFSTLSQLGLILQLSRSDYGGPIFVACCVAMPLFDIFVQPNLWTQCEL